MIESYMESKQQYTCPMHPEVVKDAPGQCPKCGMNLVPVPPNKVSTQSAAHHHHGEMTHDTNTQKHDHRSGGTHAHHAGMIDEFKKRFYVVLILTIPIMALSPMIQHWLNVDRSFNGSNYILLLLASVVFLYGGWPFLVGLLNEVKSKALGMMTLVAVAITVAYVYSVAIVLGLEGMAQADIGIAVGSGSDIAAETSDIVLVNSNPRDVANLILFGKSTYRKMMQNLAWATGYNVVALPLAAGVLYNAGIMLSPAAGAVLMSASTIVVAINAQLLKIRR
jgi:cation transport ATPase